MLEPAGGDVRERDDASDVRFERDVRVGNLLLRADGHGVRHAAGGDVREWDDASDVRVERDVLGGDVQLRADRHGVRRRRHVQRRDLLDADGAVVRVGGRGAHRLRGERYGELLHELARDGCRERDVQPEL